MDVGDSLDTLSETALSLLSKVINVEFNTYHLPDLAGNDLISPAEQQLVSAYKQIRDVAVQLHVRKAMVSDWVVQCIKLQLEMYKTLTDKDGELAKLDQGVLSEQIVNAVSSARNENAIMTAVAASER